MISSFVVLFFLSIFFCFFLFQFHEKEVTRHFCKAKCDDLDIHNFSFLFSLFFFSILLLEERLVSIFIVVLLFCFCPLSCLPYFKKILTAFLCAVSVRFLVSFTNSPSSSLLISSFCLLYFTRALFFTRRTSYDTCSLDSFASRLLQVFLPDSKPFRHPGSFSHNSITLIISVLPLRCQYLHALRFLCRHFRGRRQGAASCRGLQWISIAKTNIYTGVSRRGSFASVSPLNNKIRAGTKAPSYERENVI